VQKIRAKHGNVQQFFELISSILADASDPVLRRNPYDFSRDGTLSPDLVVTLLLFMVGDANRRGYRHLLDAFWDECASFGVPLPADEPVSASAFCQARQKISPNLLRHVLHEISARFERAFPDSSRWHGRRVFAVDGAKKNLQRSTELDARFGRPESAHCPQATISTLLNVSGCVPADLVIAPYAACERTLLLEHLPLLRPGDVLVLDRGYPSHDVLRRLLANGIDFLVRVPASHTFEAVEVLRQSGGDDYRVLIRVPPDAPRGTQPIELRALRLTNPNGDESFYLTSLRRSEFSRRQLAELYHLRWKAEEFYKLTSSSYFDQRQFHAKSRLGIEQEILAQAIFVAIARFLLGLAADDADAPHGDLSVKAAVLACAAYLTRLFLDDPYRALHWLPRLLARIARTRDKRRPNRSCPRRSFKPSPRWGPIGRRGA
jgi:hypothetical protein